MSVQQQLEQALALHQTGKFSEAAAGYRKILRKQPAHIDALHCLGLAERALGELASARARLERVVAIRPGFAEARGNLGLVYSDLGELALAEQAARAALELKHGMPEVWLNLGHVLRRQGRIADALGCYEQALTLRPQSLTHQAIGEVLLESGAPEAARQHFESAALLEGEKALLHYQIGTSYAQQSNIEAAIAAFYRATQLQPDFAEAHNELGNALAKYDRTDEAIVCFERALALKPDLVEALNNLGNALSHLGRPSDAVSCFVRALELRPDTAELHQNFGIVLYNGRRYQEALECFEQALKLKPNLATALNNAGLVLKELGRHAEAISRFESALLLEQAFPEACNNLGNVYKGLGNLQLALEYFARAVELKPDYSSAHSNFLFTLNFADGVTPADIATAHRDWGVRHAGALPVYADYANTRDPARRLRIGYISTDFCAHACAYFMEPLLRYHDRANVEVHAFAELVQADAVTGKLQALVDRWHLITGLRDEEVAARIHAAEIDILIDLNGHTANHRLLSLARRPAPVQVTYLGYPATTGLDAVSWRLTDGVTEPTGDSDQFYTERLYRLPNSLWCYQAPLDMRAITPLPALENTFVTFGSFNSYSKVGPRVVALWADVLQAVPDSKIILITVPSGAAQEELWQHFESFGVARSRVLLRDRLARADYIQTFSEVDIALDPFPCNGGTTTCDSLWMGLPVVALKGNTFLSRASLSVLTAAGYPEFAAVNEDDYIARCVSLASDLPALERVRRGMREQVAQSALTDATGFACDVEEAYRAMWRDWCGHNASGT